MLKSIVRKASELLNPTGPVDERRDSVRLSCLVAVHFDVNGTTRGGTVRDVSTRGLLLETDQVVDKGQRITVSLADTPLEQGPVICKVVWCRPLKDADGFAVGARFLDNKEARARSWLDGLLGSSEAKERRNFIRFPAPSLEVLLVGDEGHSTHGKLLNLGFGGALVAATQDLLEGSVVRFQLPPNEHAAALDVLALVRSCKLNQRSHCYTTGVEFSKPGVGEVRKYLRALKKLEA